MSDVSIFITRSDAYTLQNTSYLKIAILEKCQIHRYLSRDLTRIHKNKHYVSFAYFYVKMYDVVLFIERSVAEGGRNTTGLTGHTVPEA